MSRMCLRASDRLCAGPVCAQVSEGDTKNVMILVLLKMAVYLSSYFRIQIHIFGWVCLIVLDTL